MTATSMADADAQAAQMPFIRNLASSDRKLRTQSLATLQAYLRARTQLSAADARKLWTGLYFALWMTDRARAQQALADSLAALVDELRDSASVASWLAGFWAVLSARWLSIDALRLNKFLLLVRRVFAAQLRWLRGRAYAAREAAIVLTVLREGALDPEEEAKTALGLRLHVLDVWVDELQREGVLEEDTRGGDAEEGRARFLRAVGEVVETLRRSPVRSVRERAAESYADERLPWVVEEATTREDGDEEGDGEEEDGWTGFED